MTGAPEEVMLRRPVFEEVWGERFLFAMRAYIEQLEASLDDETIEVETLSGEPFDGCSDCYERESYLMAVALAITGYEAGEVRLEGSPEPEPHA